MARKPRSNKVLRRRAQPQPVTRKRPEPMTLVELAGQFITPLQGPGEFTVTDLAAQMGVPASNAKRAIEQMLAAGRIECVGDRRNGRRGRAVCYRMK